MRVEHVAFRVPETSVFGTRLAGIPLRRFPDCSHGGLAEVLALALVRVELLPNGVWNGCSEGGQSSGKLHVAVFADAEQRIFSHYPKFSLRHVG